MPQRFFNNARGSLAGPLLAGGTTLVLKAHANLPTSLAAGDWFLLTVLAETTRYGENIEVVKVTAVSESLGNLELVIERAQDGTAAVAHGEGEKAEARITRQTLQTLLMDARAYADAEIAALLDAAPGTLDTLNELAAALGDDPNFATTVTDSLATKLPASEYTAADVLAKLLTVDGAGSGVDADTLDGKQLGTLETEYQAYADAALAHKAEADPHMQYLLEADNLAALTDKAVARENLSVVERTSLTGAASLPAGTEAQRAASPQAGYIRFNSDTGLFEGFNGTGWVSVGAGATGSAGDQVFVENDQIVSANYTIPADKNASSTGPITIASGVTVTVSDGARWVIL